MSRGTEDTMDPLALSGIGRTDLQVIRLGFGGATLGDARERIEDANLQ